MNIKILVLTGVAVLLPLEVCSQDRLEAWTFYMDNDMLSHTICEESGWCEGNEDRAYTGGFGLGFNIDHAHDDRLTKAMNSTHRWLRGKQENEQDAAMLETYGLTAFTPDDLGASEPAFGDRPYASMWFYNSMMAVDVSASDEDVNARRTQFTLSFLGTNIGRDLQETIHCDWGKGACPVNGWDNDINDGFDIAFSIGKAYIYLLSGSENSQWIADTGYNFGLYTEGNLGLSWRFGSIYSPYYTFESDPFFSTNKFTPESFGKDHYGWISIRSHLVLYNGLLQGWHILSDEGPVSYDYDEIEQVVYSASIGYTFPIASCSFTYKVQARTSEIDSELSKDHAWGGLYFGCPLGG